MIPRVVGTLRFCEGTGTSGTTRAGEDGVSEDGPGPDGDEDRRTGDRTDRVTGG